MEGRGEHGEDGREEKARRKKRVIMNYLLRCAGLMTTSSRVLIMEGNMVPVSALHAPVSYQLDRLARQALRISSI